jgi:lipopolysaccharide export system protein LptC
MEYYCEIYIKTSTLPDKLVPNDFKQKIEIEIKGLKRIEKANKLTKNQRRRLLDLRKYEFRFIWLSCPFLPTWRN